MVAVVFLNGTGSTRDTVKRGTPRRARAGGRAGLAAGSIPTVQYLII